MTKFYKAVGDKCLLPIGTIYINVNSTNPSTWFNGTWERFGQGRMLLSVNDNDANLKSALLTGGEYNHTLTIDEMPKHNHSLLFDQSFAPGTNGVRTGVQTAWTDQSSFIGYKGGDKPHNNMPPYITVYMWKRTK